MIVNMTPSDRLSYNKLVFNRETVAAIMRSRESRAIVLSAKASVNSAFSEEAAKAVAEACEAQKAYDLICSEVDNFDGGLEGTRMTLSDTMGNFPANARVARAGGTHIEGSNSDFETGEQTDDPEDAGGDPVISGIGVSGYGGRPETPKGTPLVVDEEETGNTRRRRGSKRESRARQRANREGAE